MIMRRMAVIVWACFALLVFAFVAVAAFFAVFGNWVLMIPAAVLVGWMVRDAWRLDRL